MIRVTRASTVAATVAALVAGALGCSRDSSNASATPASGAAGGGAPGGPGGPGGGGRSITLGPTDVAAVKRGSVEAGVPITGDLRPIETVEIRARLEGDLEGVYVREGERVGQGQLLARFEASEQESGRQSAEADKVAAQGELSTAEWQLEQSEELFKAGAIAERDVRAARQAVASGKARVAAADARIRATGSLVRDTRVLAPTTGIVATRGVENGEHIARGAVMFTLVRTDNLELTASVPSRLANGVVAGQRVRFAADGRAFEGRVDRISPTIDPASRAITVYVRVPNANGALKGGTFASGRIVDRAASNVLVVPNSAVRQGQGDGRPYVFRVANQTLEQSELRLGIVDEAQGVSEVVEGLSEGDRVVVGNVGALGRGMKVSIAGAEAGGREARAENGRGADTSAPRASPRPTP